MKYILIAAIFLPVSALAQQQASTPSEQAMGTKLLQEIQIGLNCSADLILLRSELAKEQARIKELEAKDKPKAEDKP